MPRTRAQLAQPQQNTVLRHMTELRAAPAHQTRRAPLARLHRQFARRLQWLQMVALRHTCVLPSDVEVNVKSTQKIQFAF